MSLLQILNLISPLITYPYLIRVLGKENYGLVVFAQAIIGYLVVLVGFGFNISATKEVSIYRDNKEKLSQIISSVFIIKGGLLFLSFLLLSMLLYYITEAHGYEDLFFLTMWICLADVLFPVWYFQGIEQMKYITYFTFISRIFTVLMIFIFINLSTDFLLLPIINGIGALISAMFSLYIIFCKHGIKFELQPYSKVHKYFKESIPIFISNVSIALYVSTNKVIIGTILGMTEVAYYDLGEKITSILKIPQNLLSQTLFPKINKDKNISFVKKIFIFSVVINFLITLFVISFSKYIVVLLGGEEMLPAVWIVNILAASVPIIAMGNIFGILLLIPFGRTKIFSKIIISSGVIYLIQLFVIQTLWSINVYSVSIITLTTEIVVTTAMFYYCKKYNLW